MAQATLPSIGISDYLPEQVGRRATVRRRHVARDVPEPPAVAPSDPETRQWLARELHDTVGTPLATMLLQIEQLKRREDEAGVRLELDELQHSTREVLTGLRRMLHELRDEPAQVTGFLDLVQEALGRFERQTRIRTSLVSDERWPRRMASRTVHHLLRIIDEALQNVARHSRAETVEVTLDYGQEVAVVRVRDDGRGLPEQTDGQRHGITGMAEYATLAGGNLRVESWPGGGTAVTVTLPEEAIR